MWTRLWLVLQRALVRRERRDRDIDDEIRFHLEQEARLRVERGASPARARREALLAFGSPSLAKETTRSVWVSTRLEQLAQDLRLGGRILVTSPGVSATAVLLLMLVIGGNTTVFSIANGILRKPAPGVRSDRLVTLNWIQPDGFVEPASSYANYVDLAAQTTALRPLIAFRPYVRLALAHDRGTQAANGTLISANYFEAYGVALIRGRTFTRAEHDGVSGLAAIVSHRFWRETLQGRDDVVGLSVAVNGTPATIVGVVEPGFEGTRLAEAVHVWVPLLGYSRLTGTEAKLWNRADFTIVIGGRLADGISLTQAGLQTDALWSRLQTSNAMTPTKATMVPYSAAAGSGVGIGVVGDRMLALFSVVTLMTLVVVCANVANLLLARAVMRQRELAVRQSLGASQWRVLRMLLAEGLVISAIAMVAAFVGAWWVSRALVRLFPEGPWTVVAAMDLSPDWKVALYAVLLAMVAVVSFTVAPALRAWRIQILPWLKAGEQDLVQGRSRTSRVLVVVQLALAVVLLTNAGLVYRSLCLMGSADPGFKERQLLSVQVSTSASAATGDANRLLLERLRERFQAISGVVDVTYAQSPLFRDGGWAHAHVRTPGSSAGSVDVQRNHVGPRFFSTLAIAASAGEAFGLREGAGTSRRVVISRNLAEALWPGQSAIGRAITVDPGLGYEPLDGTTKIVPGYAAEVVGVSADGSFSRFAHTRQRFLFLSAAQDSIPPGDVPFYVRYTGPLDAVARGISTALRDVDTRVATVSMTPMEDVVEGALWPQQVLATLLSSFAAISFVIAAIGQYALVSFDMRRRTRELGLRMAIGASSRQVLAGVVSDGMRLTAIGLTLGFTLSLLIGQGLSRVLFGVTPTDAMTYSSVFASLTLASLLACYMPARRAARINPISALRYE